MRDAGKQLISTRARVLAVPGAVAAFQTVHADLNVLLVGFENASVHRFGSVGAVQLERGGTAHDPRSKDQVGESKSVVGVQVGEESNAEVFHFQSRGTGLSGHAHASVNQVDLSINPDGERLSLAFGLRAWSSGAQEDYLWNLHGLGLREGHDGPNAQPTRGSYQKVLFAMLPHVASFA